MRSFLLWISVVLGCASIAMANPRFSEVLKQAKSGDTKSQYIAGMMLMFGQDTRPHLTEAVRWFQLSAKGGLPHAKLSLAVLYDVGQGVPFDPQMADQLRREAASAGNPTARGQIENDQRMPGQRDFRRAWALSDMKLYEAALPFAKRSAEAGSANGQLLFGRAYHFALGTNKNYAEALKWYLKSDAGKLADGSLAVGYMYEFGLGVAVNRAKALVYYDRATARGSMIAKQSAANLRSPDYDQPRRYQQGEASFGTTCSSGFSYDSSRGMCVGMYPGLTPYNP